MRCLSIGKLMYLMNTDISYLAGIKDLGRITAEQFPMHQ